jgi:hypothetical protein
MEEGQGIVFDLTGLNGAVDGYDAARRSSNLFRRLRSRLAFAFAR